MHPPVRFGRFAFCAAGLLAASSLFACGSAPAESTETSSQVGQDLVVAKCPWPESVICDDIPKPNGSITVVCSCYDPAPAPAASALAAGAQTTYALVGNSVAGWGSNANCALAQGPTTLLGKTTASPASVAHPVLVVANPAVSQVVAGDTGACALSTSNTALCWGTLTTSPTLVTTCTPTAVAGLPAVTQLAHGISHGCAIDTNEFVWCWGDDQYGQLGDHQAEGVPGAASATAIPVAPALVNHIVEIVAGGNTTCARSSNNAIFCWGDDSQGGLGDGSGAGKSINGPIAVGGWTMSGGSGGATSLFGGGNGTFCGQDAWTEKMLCWGANTFCQAALTSDATLASCANGLGPSPSAMNSTEGPLIALGKNHSCVGGTASASSSSTLGCVGGNGVGQLGDGNTSNSFSLQQVSPVSGAWFTRFAVGDNHTCAVVEPIPGSNSYFNSNVYCWGSNASGQLTGSASSLLPVAVSWYTN